MAATYTLSGNPKTLLGSEDFERIRAYITCDQPMLTAADTGEVRVIGEADLILATADATTFSVDLPGNDWTPSPHFYTLHIEGRSRTSGANRVVTSQPFQMTADITIAELPQAAPKAITVTDYENLFAAAEEAQVARDEAVAAAEQANAPTDGQVGTSLASRGLPTSGSELSASTEAIVDDLAVEQSSTGFLRMAGTVPGAVPVAKPTGDGRAGVWEMTHNDTAGYLFHLLAGTAMGHAQALIALGVDNDGIGLLIPNKKNGRALVIDQKSTAANAYGVHVTQTSTTAPAVRMELNVAGAASLLQLLALGSSTGTLLEVGDTAGTAGRIDAVSGLIDWRRNVQVSNKQSGEVPNYLVTTTSSAANSTNTRRAYRGAAEATYFGATGAAGVYYAYRFAHGGSQAQFQVAANLAAADPTAPLPSEPSSWLPVIGFRYSSGARQIGFYGATPVSQPAAVADATDAATVITQLNALLARIRSLGLITT